MFTWNNPSGYLGLLEAWYTNGLIKSGGCQLERGGEKGVDHLQGAVEFSKQMSLKQVKAVLPLAHWEPRKGTIQQAQDYATKEESRVEGPWRVGEVKGQGKRSDLQALKASLDNPEEDPWEEHFGTMLKYWRGAEIYKSRKMAIREELTKVEVHFGVPGTGKTELVTSENPGAYWKQASKWWDHYSGQDVVVLDEFLGWMPYHELLKLCDGTPLWVEAKGSQKSFISKKVVLISNREPHHWYKWEEAHLDWGALERRLSRDGLIYHHKKGQEPDHYLDYDSYLNR